MKMRKKILAGVVATNMLLISNMANVDAAAPLGVEVTADAGSPSGYTVSFAFDTNGLERDFTSVAVTGPFNYFKDYTNLKEGFMDGTIRAYKPDDYENGMYPSNLYLDTNGGVVASRDIEMSDDNSDGVYEVSFPITSGSFDYHYTVTYTDDLDSTPGPDVARFVDPYNITDIKNSDVNPELINYSTVIGKYDPVKQSDSPDFSFVEPSSGVKGTLSYEKYTGVLGVEQNLGVYLPPNYDASRQEPYRVIYASHGGGGMETDWFAAAHVDNIMDNLYGLDSQDEAIVVTMNNSDIAWDFGKIEDNVLNYIIPFMESNYNVSSEVADRAFCGLSMGGMTTTHMYFDHPEAFGYFGIFSGTDMSAVSENENLDSPLVMIAAGTLDVATRTIMDNPPDRQIKVEDLIDYLKANDFTNFKDYGLLPGSHDWFVWSSCFEKFASEICWSRNEAQPVVNSDNQSEKANSTADSTAKTEMANPVATADEQNTIIKTGDTSGFVSYAAMAAVAFAVIIKLSRKSSTN